MSLDVRPRAGSALDLRLQHVEPSDTEVTAVSMNGLSSTLRTDLVFHLEPHGRPGGAPSWIDQFDAADAAGLVDTRPFEIQAETSGLSPMRQRMLDLVRLQPGCNLAETSRDTGLRHAALLQHLVPMIRGRQIHAGDTRHGVFLFLQVNGIEAWWPQVVALRDQATARMHAFLLKEGRCDLGSVVEHARAELEINRTGIRNRLKTLMETSLVQSERRDSARRMTVYRAVPAGLAALNLIKWSWNEGHRVAREAHRTALLAHQGLVGRPRR